ncbi:hypothetical protein NPIL_501601 [Nephila pilipes]|uniref:Uncharacterized protein n=1 Tax=Nephila pilipes TaxID=299642 RepID=A0A8X6T573_NEPPI|nr:hypothetical protein NPIL_501601 [Nephila pilipes]
MIVVKLENLKENAYALTVREIEVEARISKYSAHQILCADLNMSRVAAKFLLIAFLSFFAEYKECHLENDLLDITRTNPDFLNTAINHVYMGATLKQKYYHCNDARFWPSDKTAQQVPSKIQVILNVITAEVYNKSMYWNKNSNKRILLINFLLIP